MFFAHLMFSHWRSKSNIANAEELKFWMFSQKCVIKLILVLGNEKQSNVCI